MTWLGNVKQPPTEIKRSLRANLVDQSERVLTFVQQEQPTAKMGDLMEVVLESFLKKDEPFGVIQESKQFGFEIPADLKVRVDERLEEIQKTHPKASERHLLEQALESYFRGQTKLMKAWRASEKAQQAAPERVEESKAVLVSQGATEQTSGEQGLSSPGPDVGDLLARANRTTRDTQDASEASVASDV